MKAPVFTGTCTAVITPFTPAGSIDYSTFSRQLERQIEAGVDAVCVCGTTGESATLTTQEHIRLVSYCSSYVAGRCKVIAGCGSNDTAEALYLCQHAQESEADALLVVTPYYNKTTQEGLIQHYEELAEHTYLPIILYNVPSRTGLSFTAKTYEALSKHPRINGVKEASGDFSLLLDTLSLCGDDLNVWSGNDDHTIPMLALGAKGLISVASNLIPKEITWLTHSFLEGKQSVGRDLQIEYAPLLHALFSQVNPIPIKAAMTSMGLDGGTLRLPLCAMEGDALSQLHKVMQRFDLL